MIYKEIIPCWNSTETIKQSADMTAIPADIKKNKALVGFLARYILKWFDNSIGVLELFENEKKCQ